MAYDRRITESASDKFRNIERLNPFTSLDLQLEAQIDGLNAIKSELKPIAEASRAAISTLQSSPTSRIVYVGAGTSGRLGVQDGSELTPTFRWPSERLAFVVAGGLNAVFKAVEGAEDSKELAVAQMRKINVGQDDVVIGLAASGSTPFTVMALRFARDRGATTIGIANNKNSALANTAAYPITVVSGAEAISGSTRLAAGTTQKVVLNMLSNQIMMGIGKVIDGQMVDMNASNVKLQARAVRMIMRLTNCEEAAAQKALEATDYWVKPAILMARSTHFTKDEVLNLIESYDGNLYDAIGARPTLEK